MNETLENLKKDYADACFNLICAEKETKEARIWESKCYNMTYDLKEEIKKEMKHAIKNTTT